MQNGQKGPPPVHELLNRSRPTSWRSSGGRSAPPLRPAAGKRRSAGRPALHGGRAVAPTRRAFGGSVRRAVRGGAHTPRDGTSALAEEPALPARAAVARPAEPSSDPAPGGLAARTVHVSQAVPVHEELGDGRGRASRARASAAAPQSVLARGRAANSMDQERDDAGADANAPRLCTRHAEAPPPRQPDPMHARRPDA